MEIILEEEQNMKIGRVQRGVRIDLREEKVRFVHMPMQGKSYFGWLAN